MVWIKKIYVILLNLERLLMLFLNGQFKAMNPSGNRTINPSGVEEVEPEAEVWMAPHEVRAYLDISESTYFRYLKRGTLKGCSLDQNAKLYFRKKDIDLVLNASKGKWKK